MAQPSPQPNPLENPNVENLWQSFLDYCYNLNQARAAEDAEDIGVRQRELNAFLKLNTPESLATYQQAVAFDTKWAKIHAQRTEFDAALIRQIFESAIRLNVHLVQNPDVVAVPANPSGPAGASQAVSNLNGMNTLNFTGSPTAPSKARQSAVKFEPKVETLDVKVKNEHGATLDPNRPASLTMDQLAKHEVIVAHPKTNTKKVKTSFYVLRCPILGCGRAFESAHGMFGHLSQSDSAHLDLFGPDPSSKNFKKAVELAGIKVIDAELDAVDAHNAKAVEVG
ncbi:hypothetical protein BDZ45DRAFT_678222 [Acephala macrosclerotiorum]|nr:hypothetical protein BDZ45DRAFT_678222 [Acephala macrosclerotiorum]